MVENFICLHGSEQLTDLKQQKKTQFFKRK